MNRPFSNISQLSLFPILIVALLQGCGGPQPAQQPSDYAAGSVSADDLANHLKFDARIEGFETSGTDLIVNVNEAWVSSPPGIQERSTGKWYAMWIASQTAEGATPAKGLKVSVRHRGDEVARWSDSGFKPVKKPNNESDSDG